MPASFIQKWWKPEPGNIEKPVIVEMIINIPLFLQNGQYMVSWFKKGKTFHSSRY